MSSTIAFPLTLTKNNATTYLTGSASIGGSYIAVASAFSTKYANLNNAAKDVLYPNATAHPIKLDASMRHSGYGVDRLQFSGTQIFIASDGNTNSVSGRTDSVIIQSNSATEIRYVIDANGSLTARLADASLTLYFNCYDFSATAGSGVTSASVSSSTGYGGASITFSCVIPTGYIFDGWYSGTTLVSSSQSYTYTIPTDNAANYDLALTAKAHQDTHNVNGTYNGSTKAILSGITGDVTVSYNGKTKTLNSSAASHTLSCANKVMHGNVSVGSATPLHCAEKLMRSPLVIKYV